MSVEETCHDNAAYNNVEIEYHALVRGLGSLHIVQCEVLLLVYVQVLEAEVVVEEGNLAHDLEEFVASDRLVGVGQRQYVFVVK